MSDWIVPFLGGRVNWESSHYHHHRKKKKYNMWNTREICSLGMDYDSWTAYITICRYGLLRYQTRFIFLHLFFQLFFRSCMQPGINTVTVCSSFALLPHKHLTSPPSLNMDMLLHNTHSTNTHLHTHTHTHVRPCYETTENQCDRFQSSLSVHIPSQTLSWHLLDYLLQPHTPTLTHTHAYTHTHTHTHRERGRERLPPHGRSKPLWAIWNVVGAGETRYCWLCHIAFAATRQERVCLTARRYDSVSHPPAQQQAVGRRRRRGGGGGGGGARPPP